MDIYVHLSPSLSLLKGYCVGIEIAEVVSASDLLSSLKAKGVQSPDMSRGLGTMYVCVMNCDVIFRC